MTAAWTSDIGMLGGLQANADLSSYQHRFVYLAAAKKVSYCATQGMNAVGVLTDAPDTAGDAANVAYRGVAKVEAGAAVAAGAAVMTDSVGRCITAADGGRVLGYAIFAASGAGEKISVALQCGGEAKYGRVNLPLDSLREINSDDITNLAGHGGIMASDSTPILERISAAADKGLQIKWVATDEAEAQFGHNHLPGDLDASQDVTVHLKLAKGSNTDTAAVIAVGAFVGTGDSNAGGNTAALAVATEAEYTVTLAAADITAHAPLALTLKPGTHANDDIYLRDAWLEYTKL